MTKDSSRGKIVDVILKLNTDEPINKSIILRDGNNTIAIGIIYE